MQYNDMSKSFEMQEIREIGRKEAGESRGFSVLWMEKWKMSSRWKERNAKSRRV